MSCLEISPIKIDPQDSVGYPDYTDSTTRLIGNRVSEKEQIFHTEDNDETEEPIWQRKKKEARDHPTNQIPDI